METKTSKVKNVQGNGTYDSQHGMLYKFDYEFEDGTHISANHKTQSPFKVGDTVEYTVKGSNENFSWGTVSKPKENNFKSYKNNKPSSNASFALSYAKDMMCMFIETEKVTDKDADKIADKALLIANKFNQWLITNS